MNGGGICPCVALRLVRGLARLYNSYVIEIAKFPSPLTQFNILGSASEIQVPKFAKAVRLYARCCEAAACEQGLLDEQLERPGVCALLGLSEDRTVMGLRRKCGAWHISRIPVPSALVPLLGPAPLTGHTARPVWVRLLPGYLGVFKEGKEVSVWDGRRPAVGGAAKALRGSISPGPDI